jgi:hypothetical protein
MMIDAGCYFDLRGAWPQRGREAERVTQDTCVCVGWVVGENENVRA